MVETSEATQALLPVTQADRYAFEAGKPKDVLVTDIIEAHQHTAEYAIGVVAASHQISKGKTNGRA